MKKLYKIVIGLLVLTLVFAACAPAAVEEPAEAEEAVAEEVVEEVVVEEPTRIGVSMSASSSERWVREGDFLQADLEALGYEVDLQFAEDDVQVQISQLENMMTGDAKCLIINPIDNAALGTVLQTAADNGVFVVAYDRLIIDTPNVDYHVTFHNVNVGKGMVAAVAAELGWDEDNDEVFNVEFFTGSPDDSNAFTAYDGMTQGLQPYLDSGKVKVLSGQTEFDQVSILGWKQETAQKRMEDLIAGFYSGGEKVHAAFSPSDGLSFGIESALELAGYTYGVDWPLITGQDADIFAVKNIISGRRFLSMFRDGRVESAHATAACEALLNGEEPEVNSTDFDNNVKVVPTFVLDATPVTIENYKEILIDGGYYTEADLEE